MKNKNKAKQETIDVSDMPDQVLYKSEKRKWIYQKVWTQLMNDLGGYDYDNLFRMHHRDTGNAFTVIKFNMHHFVWM